MCIRDRSRLANLSLEDMIPDVSPSAMPGTYLPQPSEDEPTETRLPEPPSNESSSSKLPETQLMTVPQPQQIPAEPESDWIKRMNSQ